MIEIVPAGMVGPRGACDRSPQAVPLRQTGDGSGQLFRHGIVQPLRERTRSSS